MKWLLCSFLLLTTCLTKAQQSSAWDGNYTGQIVGIDAQLDITTQQSQLTGTINASGYLFNLACNIAGESCKGTMKDPQNGETAGFTGILSGNKFLLRLRDINPTTGNVEDMEFSFTKNTGAHSSSPATAPTSGAGAKGPMDNNLIGLWRFTDAYVSGEFSFATDYFLEFKSNNVMLYTDGRTAGGGPNTSIDSGGGDVHHASWKTENKLLYLNDGSGWQQYAKYFYENGRLMLTYNNGKKQVWEKL